MQPPLATPVRSAAGSGPVSLRAAVCALAAMLAVFLWQWLTVTVNYQGNWTALFCTGGRLGVPSLLASDRVYQFAGSTGYDGQMYHYIAHSPLMREQELKSFVDEPRLRYRRILMPALASILSFGRADWVDPAYVAVCLLAAALGVYWSYSLLEELGRPPGWAALFLLIPAVLISVDRLVVDILLAALSVGFVLHMDRPSPRLWVILAAAALTRETGILLAVGYAGSLLLRRSWTGAMKFAAAILPAAFWFLWVNANTSPYTYMASLIPFSAIVPALFHANPYPPGLPLIPLVRAGDTLALVGVLLAFAIALALACRRFAEPDCLAALCFALMGVVLQREDHWGNVYDFGRVYTPLLILLAARGLKSRSVILFLAPWLLMLPRIGMQLLPQAMGIASAGLRALR